MAKKAFNDQYPKSIALTLRMRKLLLPRLFLLPTRAQGRVLIADSWFGSVACALARFKNGIFAVLDVKTAQKEFPKAELLAEVEEIKGKTSEAKAARVARRDKQLAFVRQYSVGTHNVNVLAAGHNKMVPLLLVTTSFYQDDRHRARKEVAGAARRRSDHLP
eukprot:3823728-Pleurochrysis_carterae.AAC.1